MLTAKEAAVQCKEYAEWAWWCDYHNPSFEADSFEAIILQAIDDATGPLEVACQGAMEYFEMLEKATGVERGILAALKAALKAAEGGVK